MKNYVFIILIFVTTNLFSQFNFGVGVGQQFGVPGIRLGYNTQRIEGSVNCGMVGILQKNHDLSLIQRINTLLACGVSFKLNKKEAVNPVCLSYNYGLILTKEYDGYNYNLTPRHTQSLTVNFTMNYYKSLKFRFGIGAAYIPYNNTGFVPTLMAGFILPLTFKNK
jgi:hypothetical protein